jgi:hypothetical protein
MKSLIAIDEIVSLLTAAPPSYVDMTWMSIANTHCEIGSLKDVKRALGFSETSGTAR